MVLPLDNCMACSTTSCAGSLPYGACIDKFGCFPNMGVDFCLKRHDTKPPFKVVVVDCDGPMDLTGLVLEVSMWAKAKFKKDFATTDTQFQVADNIGFEQAMVGDIIVVSGRIRAPEQMLVTGFDETNSYIQVTRGYHGTPIAAFKKGTAIKIFRVLNAPGITEMDLEDVQQIDGTVATNQITEARLVHEWAARDTCLPGCYFLEFKLIKMLDSATNDASAHPSVPSDPSTASDFQMGCTAGVGVEWVRRYPSNAEGYVIRINNSNTSENVFTD